MIAASPAGSLPAPPTVRRRSGWAVFALATFAYTALGMVLSLHYNLVDGDGPSRVADAGYVLFSRDPHLGAIGFVWNPLPSLVELPLLELKGLWAPLQTRGEAGTLQSALFMGAAVVQIRRIAIDQGVRAWVRWIIVASFALNPMIVIFGGNGLSEAALVFCSAWASRHLMLWVSRRDVGQLVLAGIALGVGYLCRYEALAAALTAAALVAGATGWRHRTHAARWRWRPGYEAAGHDVAVLMFPVALSFAIWAGASWLLTGQLFAQFSSQYGNSSQVASALGSSAGTGGSAMRAILRAVVSIEPLLPTTIVIALALAVYRRRAEVLGAVACFGGILAFEAVAQLDHLTFGWFRFYIASVPLCVCLAASICGESATPPAAARRSPPLRVLRAAGSGRAMLATKRRQLQRGLVACALLAPSLPVTWSAMLNPMISNQFDQLGLRYLVTADRSERDAQQPFDAFNDDRAIARYLDAQHLPDASVLTDTFQGWAVWLASSDPHQFVVTSDYDFLAALNAPQLYGIRYILVSNPTYDAGVDAINRRYPSLWNSGAGIATLTTAVVRRGGGESWRIYQVIGSSAT